MFSSWQSGSDYGSKIQIKCSQPLHRINMTLDGEKCVNWRTVDSFGVQFTNFSYMPLIEPSFYLPNPKPPSKSDHFSFSPPVHMFPWTHHMTHEFGGKGFLLKDEIFYRFEPNGVTWNDSYCRKIVDKGQPGCFVERDINLFPINFGWHPHHNCTGMPIRSQVFIIKPKQTLAYLSSIISNNSYKIVLFW